MATLKNPYHYKKSARHERIIDIKELEESKRVPLEGLENYFVNTRGDVFEIRQIPQHFSFNGYPKVTLNRISFFVHHLVMLVFVGKRPEGQVIRHLNDIKTDNCLDNLCYGTYAENVSDAIKNGRVYAGQSTYNGACHHKAKLTEEIVREIRSIKSEDPSIGCVKIAKLIKAKYDITIAKQSIEAVCKFKTWKHLT